MFILAIKSTVLAYVKACSSEFTTSLRKKRIKLK